MVEWGNYWARAIRLRDHKHSEGFLGAFSQIGELYNVKHIWYVPSFNESTKLSYVDLGQERSTLSRAFTVMKGQKLKQGNLSVQVPLSITRRCYISLWKKRTQT